MSDSIKVAIKVRPLIKRERDDNLSIQWTVQGNSIISTDPEMKRRGDGGFVFDHIFDMHATNSDVFNTVVQPIVNAAVSGFNGTVFAYGQTSSGKTYTMLGDRDEPGIVPLAIEHMFDAIANTVGREFLLRVSYLEIYNEKVNDLLNKSGTDLKLKEDATGQVILKCKEEITNCPQNVLTIMKKGDKNRRIGETNMNERSSRSHTIFRITIESREAGSNSDGAIQVSQLNLVDLAGSERARQTGATGERFKEGRHINMSLSTLGLVIMQLSESQDVQKHVNFRDSKLTRLLQNSLGGNAMTTIICAVTPAALEETQCTLSFASRAKSVKNKPQVNEVMSDAALLKRYAKQLTKLQEELEKVKNENKSAQVEEMESKLLEKERVNQLLEERIEVLKTRIVSGDVEVEEESLPNKNKYKRRQTWGGPGIRMLKQLPSVCQSAKSLPTIKEVSFEKPQRKSILKSMDLMNQTFQTAFADFELELYESERTRESRDNASDSDEEPFITKRGTQRVTFQDDVFIIKTPEKCNVSIQACSPGTPQHVLRQDNMNLRKEYKELCEFTTLEKQLICQEKHCRIHGEDGQSRSTLENFKTDIAPEIMEQLKDLNLMQEKDVSHVITQLCTRLNEIEKQSILEKESNNKMTKQFSELERQIENITSERNEFEHISRELRAELKKKTAELALKNMSEDAIRQEEMKKISDIKQQLEIVTSEKTKLECANVDLRTELTKQMAESQKQMENITAERNEFEYMRRELHSELNKKSVELEKLRSNFNSMSSDIVNNKIVELETEMLSMKSERDKLEQEAGDLRAELNRVSSDYGTKIALEQKEKQETVQKCSELEKLVELITSEKNEYERVNIELKAESGKRIADLQSEVKSERMAREEAAEKIVRMETEIERVASEKNELERINRELNENVSELKSTIASHESVYQQAVDKISKLEKELVDVVSENDKLKETNTELEKKVNETDTSYAKQTVQSVTEISALKNELENVISEKNEFQRINSDLQTKFDEKILEFETMTTTQQMENEKERKQISELKKQIATIISEKLELSHVNNKLRNKLSKITSELKEKIKIEKTGNKEMMEMIADLEIEFEHITSTNTDFECAVKELQQELDRRTSELESEQIEKQKALEKIFELNKQIDCITTERNEFERLNKGLNDELKKISEFKMKLTHLETTDNICKLENEIERKIGFGCLDETNDDDEKETSAVSRKRDAHVHENQNLNNYVNDLEHSVTNFRIENEHLRKRWRNRSILPMNESNANISNLILEAEKSQLEESLHLKSQELEDIKIIMEDMTKLQEIINLLTNENMEMATKLNTEQEKAVQTEANLQKTIDELYTRISEITKEKIILENELQALKEQLDSIRSQVSENQDEQQLLISYQTKIDKLTAENIELSMSITEKKKELDNIKESKSLLYDHECIHKEKVVILEEQKKCLVNENNELSTDLMDTIEENDMLKEQCNILKNKLEQSSSMKGAESDVELLKTENNTLKGELAELKTKITILSEENAKFSTSLFETVENLDSSYNEKVLKDSLQLSAIFDVDESDIKEEEETRETLILKVATLQTKNDHLKRLNKKLSDLKLTSCNQCAHMRNLTENRRALKLEVNALNQRLNDLQKKYDRKCVNTQIEINQELNTSVHNMSLNFSFVDETHVSVVEEKIQSLNNELQILKDDHDKLSILYEDKCTELDRLQNVQIAHSPNKSKSRKSLGKDRNRLEHMQSFIDQLRNEMDQIKKNSTIFADTLNDCKTEKLSLLDEINSLRDANKELQQKMENNENTAMKTIQILENELSNMSKATEQFSAREKELESQRLMLEVEVESLKLEEQNKNDAITKLNEQVLSLRTELDLVTSQKNELMDSNVIELKNKELECLKKRCEELEKEKEHIQESEQQYVQRIKELETYINDLQKNITNQQFYCKELEEKGAYYEKLLQESEQGAYILTQKLRETEAEAMNFKNNLEIKYKNEFDSMIQQYQQRITESENNLQKLNDTLNKYIDENMNMSRELGNLRNVKEKLNETMAEKERICEQQKVLMDDNEKLNWEVNDIKKCILKELKSLISNVNPVDYSKKPITEIFTVLLQTLISKEAEVIKTMQETHEKEKRKLEEEKRQSLDTEKRSSVWAKELETDMEKLQIELTERERMHKEYQNKVSQLEYLLMESTREKEIMKEKIESLETDLSNLQADFDRRCKVDNRQGEAIVQRKEKETQELIKIKEVEMQSKIKCEKEMYEKKIDNLTHAIESYKTKILELNDTIEGLEANEKQLKNIIEANSMEIKRKNQKLESMHAEFEQLGQTCNQMSQEIEQKNARIEEIAVVLKDKCDMLSAYEAKLETIEYEYESLKQHVKDQRSVIERGKEDMQTLKKESEEQLEIIKDKLNSEEVKNTGLKKQLNELNNKNVTLIEELNDLKERYEQLEEANIKLERKIRNSTSKIKAEAEMEELRELNKRLQQNLEGATNRVTEFQEAKNRTLRDLVDVKTKYELAVQENEELKMTLSSYKSKYSILSSSMDEGKYDDLLLEKNRIALELEGKKIVLSQKENEVKQYANQIKQLTEKNKELDEELEEYGGIIRERDAEISRLEEKLYSRLTENVHINELEVELKKLRDENQELRDQADALKMRLQMDPEKDNSQNTKIMEGTYNRVKELEEERNRAVKELKMHKLLLNQRETELKDAMKRLRDLTEKNKDIDNAEINSRIDLRQPEGELDNDTRKKLEYLVAENKKLKHEIRMLQATSRTFNESSTSNDGGKMRQNTSTFYKNNEVEVECEQLKNKIHELELQLVSKNGQIATLQLQIQSENFPYQKKCKELNELVLAYRTKNANLICEVKSLQRSLNDVKTWECDICRKWRVNRVDQACQTIPNNAIRFCSVNSGVVEEHMKIQKLEKDKMFLKNVCRSRARTIKQLEDRMKELEETRSHCDSRSNKVLHDKTNQ